MAAGMPKISEPGRFIFDRNGVDREFAGKEADTGLTALVMLSFLGAGYTHEEGRYAVAVDRGLDWLINQQAADGNLCGNAEKFARMYCHAMATYCLAEACGMQKEVVLGPIVDPEALRLFMDTGELAAASLASGSHVTKHPERRCCDRCGAKHAGKPDRVFNSSCR